MIIKSIESKSDGDLVATSRGIVRVGPGTCTADVSMFGSLRGIAELLTAAADASAGASGHWVECSISISGVPEITEHLARLAHEEMSRGKR